MWCGACRNKFYAVYRRRRNSHDRRCDSLIQAGAEKVSINSAAVKKSNLVVEVARKFGRCATVVNIDPRRVIRDGVEIWKSHQRRTHPQPVLEAVAWAKRVEELGAGEIVLTSMDADAPRTVTICR